MFEKIKKQLTSERKSKKPLDERVATRTHLDKFSMYPSNGLTPQRLAKIFKEADEGDVYRQMELFEELEGKDPHLFSQLQTRKNAVTGLDFEIIPFSDEERDKQIAEFIKTEIAKIENIEDIFFDMLDAIGKGISFLEIMWKFKDGHVGIDEISYVHPKKVFWDENDVLKIITAEFPQGIPVPENKFIIHRYKARSGHPSKAGILRVVSWMYLFKNYDIKDWVTFCEVYGMPIRLGTYNAGASEEDKNALMEALINIASDAAAIKPEGTEINFHEANKNSSSDVYERLARYCDEQISKAIVGQTLTSDSGGGSFAQSKTHNEVRHDLTEADCKALAATIRRDLIKPLVMFNFGISDRLPILKFACEEAEDLKQTVDVYDVLVNKLGLKISTNHLYKKFSIPKPEEEEEIAKSIQGSNGITELPKDLIINKDTGRNVKLLQNDIDNISEKAISESDKIFDKIFVPLKNLIDKSESFEELKEAIENSELLSELYKNMNDNELAELLYKTTMAADLAGRISDV